MKVLWLCNSILPNIAKKLGFQASFGGGWLIQPAQLLASREDIEFAVCSPCTKISNFLIGKEEKTDYLLFNPNSKDIISHFESFLKSFKPDVIHIFGTEYPHSYAMIKAAENMGLSDRTVINIQGVCSTVAKHYLEGLNNKTVYSYTFRDFLRHNNIYNQMLNFKKRSFYETEALKLAQNVIGRTDWDEACAKKVNPKIRYFFCNEILRKTFYKEFKWSLEGCEKHSIFVSQCSYPIKGFHYMLEAMADIVKKYPDAKLYTTGKNPLTLSFKQKLRQGYYSKYLGKLIKKYHLENNIEFLGFLKEEDMCERFLKSHVFVCSSTVENESNALSEAKILGVPSVVSFAGGMTNRIEHKKDGFLYPVNAPYMLSFYIQKIFEDDKLALRFSEASKIAAKEVNSIKANLDRLLEIYNHISNK